MSSLGPEISRVCRDFSSRVSNRIETIHSSVRLFSHSCVDRLNRISNSASSNSSSTSSIINNDVENSSANGTTSVSSSDANNANDAASPANSGGHNSVPECLDNFNASSTGSSSRHSSNRRSSRRDRARSSHRNSNYPYPHGLISIRTLEKDRNLLAAILSIVVIAILATALCQFKWFSIYNDLCDSHFYSKSDSSDKDTAAASASDGPASQILEKPAATLPRQQAFLNAYHSTSPVVIYGLAPNLKLGCATPQILALKRTIIGLCFLAIMCSMIQFFLDMGMGTKRKFVNSMRAMGVLSICTVLLCVLIIGLCYFVSILYERVQMHNLYQFHRKWRPSPMVFKPYPSKTSAPADDKGQFDFLTVHPVKFELSYYLVTIGGFASILAAAANLFRRPRQIFIERISNTHSRHRNRLHGDESLLLGSDLLNSDSAGYLPFYHPGSWMFQHPTVNSLYNTDPASGSSHVSSRPGEAGESAPPYALPPPNLSSYPAPPPYTP